MKKLIILTLAFALIMASAALASNTRVLTMGDNHVVLTDDANIWNWASRLNNYPSLAVGEFGQGSNDLNKFGVHWQFGDDKPWVLATYFEDFGNFFPYWGLPFGTIQSNKRGTFFYARAMGTNKFGARASYIQSSNVDADTTSSAVQSEQSFRYLEGQVALTSADDSWDIALTGGFGSFTNTRNDTVLFKPDGLIDLALLGRMFWGGGTNYNYVPHASLEYHKGGFDTFAAGVSNFTDVFTNMTIDLGIGQIYTPSANVEAVLDLGLALQRNKEEFTDPDSSNGITFEEKVTFTTIPYFKLGLDAEVFSWLDARFGATSFWQKYKDEFTQGAFNGELRQSYADNQTYLGFGFHWGNLHVDTYTDPDLFLEGFDFISGNTDSRNSMNFQISAVYDLK